MCEKELKYLDPVEMGRRIRRQREFLGLTREELSGRLGVSSKFVADVEYGEKGISIKKLYALSQILEISTDYILAGQKTEDEQCSEKIRVIEDIVEPLKHCSVQQLKYLEYIAKYYVEAIKTK